MKTRVYHLQINVSDPKKSLPFYRDLLEYFDYKIIDESEEHIGASNDTTDFWIIATESEFKNNAFHRKNTGLNHISFRVEDRKDIDRFHEEFLKPRGIATLYSSPKDYPEYSENYYAVFFEDPDRIKLEVAYL